MKRALLLLLLICTGTLWATVPNVPYSVSFSCSGSLGPYPFTFPISDPTALSVYVNGTLVTQAGNYTIIPVNNNYNNGGSITLTPAYGPCAGGSTLLLLRTTPQTQTVVFQDNMPIPMKTFERSLDKLTEIDQEIWGETVHSVQMAVGGSNYLLPASGGVITFNFVGCLVSGTQTGLVPNTVNSYTISCSSSGGGSVTSVSGTTNQIDVANPTTTPVVSLDSVLVFPGTITMGGNLADFHLATVKLPGGGLLALGTSNQNWGTLGTGVVLNTTGTGALAVIAPAGTKCYPFQGSGGTGCDTPVGSAPAFSTVTSGTNTIATMVIGSGGSLGVSGSGTNTATSAPFSGISTSTNTTATMTVGTGGTITPSGSGVVNANEVNAAVVPASATVLASNSSRQVIAATGIPQTIASGTATMGTSLISANTCATTVTVSATGVATTDRITATPNVDPSTITGYGPGSGEGLYINAWPTANNVNFAVCNGTGNSITPGSALTLNWSDTR